MRLLGADGIPMQGVRIVDGSGLSLLDRLTADALVAILRSLYADTTLRPILMRSLPVAGTTGTLRRRMSAAPLGGTSSRRRGRRARRPHGGFVKSRYAFAIIQNGHPIAYWWARARRIASRASCSPAEPPCLTPEPAGTDARPLARQARSLSVGTKT